MKEYRKIEHRRDLLEIEPNETLTDDRYTKIDAITDIIKNRMKQVGVKNISQSTHLLFQKGTTLVIVLKSDTTQQEIIVNFFE